MRLTEPHKVVKRHGVTLIGYTDLPSRLAAQSSQLYATNLRHLLTDMCPEKDGELVVDMEDEVVRGATVVKGNEDHLATAGAEALGGAAESARAGSGSTCSPGGGKAVVARPANDLWYRWPGVAGTGHRGPAFVHGAFHGLSSWPVSLAIW